jgi:uncharacterized membrane protein YtjA (UPF0391 family)
VNRQEKKLRLRNGLIHSTLNNHLMATKEMIMLGWALAFLIVALIAGALGFTGVAAISVDAAQLIFWVFLVLFVVSLIANFARGKRPPAL